MDLGLHNKVALVTAASRGLGRALALRLALEGSQVAICARGAAELAATAEEIQTRSGQEALAVTADVTRPEDIDRLVEQVLAHFGRIDVLVTNAGGPPPSPFLELSPSDWEMAWRLTLMSAVRLCYAVVPAMVAQGSGAILMMTSLSVRQPQPNLILSSSMRLAVTGLAKNLADELAPSGVRVNCILPGWVRTQRIEQLLADRAARAGTSAEDQAAGIVADIPLGRMGTPEEFAAAAAFLVSPAASYITGVNLLVDGGMYRGTV